MGVLHVRIKLYLHICTPTVIKTVPSCFLLSLYFLCILHHFSVQFFSVKFCSTLKLILDPPLNMPLSQRDLTYGIAFPLLNIGILQSMKHIRISNFLKRLIIPKRLAGMGSERILVLTTGKISLKYICCACVSVKISTIPKM